MKKSPRVLLWFIILLTILTVLINLHSKGFLSFTKSLSFKEGLDLAGGTSLTLKADMKNISQAQRNKALESVKDDEKLSPNILPAYKKFIKDKLEMYGIIGDRSVETKDIKDKEIIVKLLNC